MLSRRGVLGLCALLRQVASALPVFLLLLGLLQRRHALLKRRKRGQDGCVGRRIGLDLFSLHRGELLFFLVQERVDSRRQILSFC